MRAGALGLVMQGSHRASALVPRIAAFAALLAVTVPRTASGDEVTYFFTFIFAQPIPDLGLTTVQIDVTINPRAITDVDVGVRLDHTYDSDLVITLIHPNGTRFELSSNNGGSGDNYGSGSTDCSGTKTVFDGAAQVSIVAGSAPFAGTFAPESPLGEINGLPMKGVWKLEVKDTASNDVGTVYCMTMAITSTPNAYDVDLNGVVSPLTDGLLLLRWFFGFRGAILINGAVGQGCGRCSAPAIEEFLAHLGQIEEDV